MKSIFPYTQAIKKENFKLKHFTIYVSTKIKQLDINPTKMDKINTRKIANF